MTYLTNLPYPILESVVKCLDNKNLKTLSCVNKTIRHDILKISTWEDRIGFYTITKGIREYLKRSEEHQTAVEFFFWVQCHIKSIILIKRTLCIDGLIRVYIPVHLTHRSRDMEKLVTLESEYDVRAFLYFEKPSDHENTTIYFDGVRTKIYMEYGTIIRPLVDLANRCTIQYNDVGRSNVVIRSNTPVLEFTVKHTIYIELYRHLRDLETKRNI